MFIFTQIPQNYRNREKLSSPYTHCNFGEETTELKTYYWFKFTPDLLSSGTQAQEDK